MSDIESLAGQLRDALAQRDAPLYVTKQANMARGSQVVHVVRELYSDKAWMTRCGNLAFVEASTVYEVEPDLPRCRQCVRNGWTHSVR